MTGTDLNELKKTVDQLSVDERFEEESASLEKAFALFSQETIRLEKAYKDLKKRFGLIEKKLQDSYSALQEKNIQLERTTKNLETILSHMTQGIIFIDRNKTILTYNSAALHILGSRISDTIFIEECLEISLDQVFQSGKAAENLFFSLSIDQQIKELEISLSFVKAKDDSIEGMILLIKDMTELRRLQMAAALNDRLKELGEMAARLAHEIRNPLSGIQGFANLLLRDLEYQPKQREMAQAILEGAMMLDHLVNNVLDYTKPIQMHFQKTDLVQLIHKMLNFVVSQKNSKIYVEVHCGFEELMLLVDPDLMHLAFLNLTLNAFQAMENGGTLSIHLSKTFKTIEISFSDTGIGMTNENVEKLFTPFFTTKKTGHGLGLAEVHKIIELHGGVIDVITEQNLGTNFLITLPIKV